jgi:hypothetical protein
VSDHQPAHSPRDTYRASACDGKVAFATFTQAQLIAVRGTRRGKSRQVYHCTFCHQFHLGRRPINQRQRRRARQADEE